MKRPSASQTPETAQGYTDPRTRPENLSAASSGTGTGSPCDEYPWREHRYRTWVTTYTPRSVVLIVRP